MSDSPLVSVYITTRNRRFLLERALKSVLAQTWDNIEIIICDDASSDDTCSLVRNYQDVYENIHYICNEVKSGACVSRNKAINFASGEFITGLDDDDFFLPARIEVLMNEYSDDYAFVCSAYIRKSKKGSKTVRDAIGELRLSELLHYNKVGNQVLTRTDRLKKVGGFDESLPAFQDYDMWIRLLKEFSVARKVNEPLYVFDVSHTSERISGSNERVKQGYSIFVNKHWNLMTIKHRNSMALLSLIINGEKLSFINAFRLCNIGNYKSILNTLLKRS